MSIEDERRERRKEIREMADNSPTDLDAPLRLVVGGPGLKRRLRPDLTRVSKGELVSTLRGTWTLLTEYENALAGVAGCEVKLDMLAVGIAAVEEVGRRMIAEIKDEKNVSTHKDKTKSDERSAKGAASHVEPPR